LQGMGALGNKNPTPSPFPFTERGEGRGIEMQRPGQDTDRANAWSRFSRTLER
jgi:hypothetical protein